MKKLIVLLLALSTLVSAQKRPFTFEDMMQLKRITDFVISPDSKWVAFTAQDVSLEKNTKTPHLWIVPVAGGETRRLTTPDAPGEDRVQFSPDGKKVSFISARDGGNQVWVQDFDPEKGVLIGDARKVTSISTEAAGQLWSPDGKWIMFVSEVWPECKDDACNKQRADERDKSKVKATLFTRLFIRHWSTYATGKRSHLFLVPAEGGVAKDVTPGDHDVPPFSLGGQDAYSFSPDGKEIAFTSNIDEFEPTSTDSNIFVLKIENGDRVGESRNLTAENKGSDSTPMYSPDGKWIAIRSQFRAGYESDRFRLRLIERSTGKITNLTENFDRWVESFGWAHKWPSLNITAAESGESPLFRVGVSGGTPVEIRPPVKITGSSNDSPVETHNSSTIVLLRSSVRAPAELFRVRVVFKKSADTCLIYVPKSHVKPSNESQPGPRECDDSDFEVQETPLTHLNEPILSQVSMQPVEPFWFTGSEKKKVQGFIVKPPNFDTNKKYPVKFLIHGGPQGQWGDDWTYRWNANLFAAEGYVVVMINPRGSTGYGQKFIDDVNRDWGGRPYKDLMMGLDYAIQTYPFIDGERVCALGASYGGYMVNWMLGHTSRFKCFVSHDGMFNTTSAYGSTEELWFPEWEFGGTPWDNRKGYDKWSPHLFAKNFKTPTLVIHGQLDYRLDVSEGFQLFTTLQRLKVPSKFLYFPDEGHWVLKPQNSQLWYKTVNDWVDSHLKPSRE